MTATNVICQPQHNCVHLGTDAAIYSSDGVICAFGNKVFTVPHWPGAIAARGLALVLPLIGHEIACRFSSFDECIDGLATALADAVESIGIDEACQFIVVGWSMRRRRPEAYVIETTDELPPGAAEALAERPDLDAPEKFSMRPLPNMVQGPMPSPDIVRAANYVGLRSDASRSDAMVCLRKIFEMQRRDTLADGIVWVGGFAQVTTVTPDGIEQQILHRWNEDEPGRLIVPSPIDWAELDGYSGKVARARK